MVEKEFVRLNKRRGLASPSFLEGQALIQLEKAYNISD
jgi:hypothetical protein